jgi:hypothetical protein
MPTSSIKTIIRLLGLSIITIVFWIGFEIYHLSSKKTLSDIPQEMLTPINPNLEQEELKKLPERLTPANEDLATIPEQKKVKFEVLPASPSASPKKP